MAFSTKGEIFSLFRRVFRSINSRFQPYCERKGKTYYLPLGGEMSTSSTVLPTQKSRGFVNKETWPNWKSPPHKNSCPWGKVRREQYISYRSESPYSVTPARYSPAAASSTSSGPPTRTSRTHEVMAWSRFHLPCKYLELWAPYTVTRAHLQKRRSGFPNSHLPQSSRAPLLRTRKEDAQIPAREDTQEQLTGHVITDSYSWLRTELFICRLRKSLG